MSDSRPITVTDKNDKGRVVIDWTQVLDDAIRYDTDDEEEVMKAKSKERKRRKAAEQAQQEEQAQLEEQARLEAKRVEREWIEAKRAEREKAEAEKAAWEAEERRVCEEEERWEAEAEASKSDEAGAGGASGEPGGEVKRVVMDPGCTCCTQAQVVCEFLVDGNKKRVACVRCNQSKGKCRWPGDRKDAEASPKATTKADKGKKQKADEELPEPGPSQKKWVKSKPTEVLEIDEPEAGGSGERKAGAGGFSGLEDKLEQLIDIVGLIANNLAGLFKAHETVAKNSGRIANVLEAMLDKSYGFGMAVSPSDSGSSELDSDELHEEAEWLKAHGEDEEEESEVEDESMAK
ncbi:hypothetical protein M404DRAFT_22628 [Pisolithus tinctorius Marx 270]|uniref:Uncharacterized protein n=1 Tax=Pisolithus tinctorius Marx 270 TaxID=870435 RepID=A0A0C3PKJ6_PISTI|nr:hypothetical protein M404DRAFT_22628 [Pisolithus tinctorius Marx 270]